MFGKKNNLPEYHFLRRDYAGAELEEARLPAEPYPLFEQWFDQAVQEDPQDANVMTLATVDERGEPDARIVLLKGFSPETGWVFFTNYLSQKGQQLAEVPRASLVFFWPKLARQVRIRGAAKRVEDAVSQAYFAQRPLLSQVSAVISPQSQEIPNRAMLEQKQNESLQGNEGFLCPAYWGGYAVMAEEIEFWQGRPNRLHDRILYRLMAEQVWSKVRLAP